MTAAPHRRRGASSRPATQTAAPRPARRGEPRLVAVALAPAPAVQAVWRRAPTTRREPLAIATPGGPVLAACPRAAAAGVQPGQSVAQARLRCPALRVAPPDRDAARALWEEILAALSAISPRIEAADPDAGVAYLDAAGLEGVWGDAAAVARAALRALEGLSLVARAGAGPTRLVALALAHRMGADGPRVVAGAEAQAILHGLPVDDPVAGLPLAAAVTLRELGIHTVGAFAALPPDALGLRFGPVVVALWRRITTGEEPPLRPWSVPETLDASRKLEGGLADAVLLERLIGVLSADLAARLRARGTAAALLTLEVVTEDDARHSARSRCWPPASTPPALHTTALALWRRIHPQAAVVAVRLQAGDLRRPEARQEALWPTHPRQRRRERLASVLAAEARRHEQLRLRRLRPDPLSEEGWRVESLAPDWEPGG